MSSGYIPSGTPILNEYLGLTRTRPLPEWLETFRNSLTANSQEVSVGPLKNALTSIAHDIRPLERAEWDCQNFHSVLLILRPAYSTSTAADTRDRMVTLVFPTAVTVELPHEMERLTWALTKLRSFKHVHLSGYDTNIGMEQLRVMERYNKAEDTEDTRGGSWSVLHLKNCALLVASPAARITLSMNPKTAAEYDEW